MSLNKFGGVITAYLTLKSLNSVWLKTKFVFEKRDLSTHWWGIWTAVLPRGEGIWTSESSKVQMAGGLPGGCRSFNLTATLSEPTFIKPSVKTTSSSWLKDRASFCYCAYALRITGYLLIQMYFYTVYNKAEEADVSKSYHFVTKLISCKFARLKFRDFAGKSRTNSGQAQSFRLHRSPFGGLWTIDMHLSVQISACSCKTWIPGIFLKNNYNWNFSNSFFNFPRKFELEILRIHFSIFNIHDNKIK